MKRLAAFTAILALGGCAGAPAPDMTARHEAGGVTVVLAVRAGLLTVTFTPPEGFHLYSMDLPAGGVDGIGFPTVARPGGALVADGPATADRAVTELRPAGLDLVVPVYPDGPVTLTVPVRAGDGDRHEVTVGYAACSANACLAPVTDESVVLHNID
ncbi:protein-disulfide reductase DsbD domain-containing protein [Actinoplanes sandaracinus]|uniref:protein-disulfide reductase DsbD domain-containing protein n=1 Tax=Actinoplanes sandaracinus TaxID=3045177 RepID=UPI0024A9BB1C|nr:protein-disulfide reductase DsbD domain-containing protein [Actinoplanes sandaracinus]